MIEELFDSYESYEAEIRDIEVRLNLAVPANWRHRSYEATQAAHERRAARKA
jgi:hypothetical protein